MTKKFFTTLLKLVIGALLIYALVVHIAWREVWMHISTVSPFFIGVYIVLYVLGIWISAYKWGIIAKVFSFSRSTFFYFKQYIIASFINNFFPSFVGGDAYRSYALGAQESKVVKSSQTVILDRFSGLFAVLFLSVMSGAFLLLTAETSSVIKMMVVGVFYVFVALVGVVIFYHSGFIQFFVRPLPQKAQTYLSLLFSFRAHKKLCSTLIWSVIFSFVGIAASNYVLFVAIGFTPSLGEYLSIIFLISIISSVPISIGNIGVKEWAYISLFGLFGVEAAVCVTVVLLSRFLQMFVSFMAFPFYLSHRDYILTRKGK